MDTLLDSFRYVKIDAVLVSPDAHQYGPGMQLACLLKRSSRNG